MGGEAEKSVNIWVLFGRYLVVISPHFRRFELFLRFLSLSGRFEGGVGPAGKFLDGEGWENCLISGFILESGSNQRVTGQPSVRNGRL